MVYKVIILLFLFPNIWGAEFRKRIYQDPNNYSQDDIRAEIRFGESMAAKMLAKYPLSPNKTWQRYVNAIGSALAASIGRSELTYYFAVVEAEERNAYALPGGFIFITSSLMNFMKDEAQLVGVLSHEIGHVNHRHIVKKLKIRGQDGLMAMSSSLIGGNTQSVRAAMEMILDQGMGLLFEEGVGPRAEYQADATAYNSLLANGFRLQSYKDLLKDLYADLEKLKVMSKTHPPGKKRITYLNRLVKRDKFDTHSGKINEDRFNKYRR